MQKMELKKSLVEVEKVPEKLNVMWLGKQGISNLKDQLEKACRQIESLVSLNIKFRLISKLLNIKQVNNIRSNYQFIGTFKEYS